MLTKLAGNRGLCIPCEALFGTSRLTIFQAVRASFGLTLRSRLATLLGVTMMFHRGRPQQRIGGAVRQFAHTECARFPKRAPNRLRRGLAGVLMLVASVLVPGCPVFSSDSACWDDSDCAPGFVCRSGDGHCAPDPVPDRAACSSPDECALGETCASNATCVPGDCTFSGCVGGWKCDVLEGRWTCVADAQAEGGTAGGAGAGGAGAPGD